MPQRGETEQKRNYSKRSLGKWKKSAKETKIVLITRVDIMIDFELDGDGGITLIDSKNLESLTKEIAALLTVVIDVMGETELTMDYPDDEWLTVWSRELKSLQKICNNGLMFTALLKDGEYNISVIFGSGHKFISDKNGLIDVAGGKIIAVETGELIQKILYPKLSLDILMELEVTPGKYLVKHSIDGNNLKLNLTEVQDNKIGIISNVINVSVR